jgi:ribonuclease D
MASFPYTYVTTPEEMARTVAALAGARIIGVDTEGASLHRYRDRVCLIQISSETENYILDPLLLDSLFTLGPILENRSILKIFHGADYDLLSLKRDFQFKIGPIFDTALAARAVGIPSFSLQSLVERFFQVAFPKTHQKSDWSGRPISQSQMDYAAGDTVYLIRLHEILSEQVRQKGRLDQIEEECRLLEEIEGRQPLPDGNDALRVKGVRTLPPEAQRIFRALVQVRARFAEARDVPSFKIISSDDLIAISKAAPAGREALLAIFTRPRSTLVRETGAWTDAVAEGLASPIPLSQKERAKRPPITRDEERLLAKLTAWRNGQATTEGVEPAMVVTGPLLTALVMNGVKSQETLSSVLRQWQIARYGEPLLQIIAGTAPTPKVIPILDNTQGE